MRVEPLDWQRGLLALSVMAYHVSDGHLMNAGTTLGRLGVYAVSMFFVLSGLSMALAYHVLLKDWRYAPAFAVHRAFRILPLLCLAVALVPGQPWDKVLLNVTGAFGFIAPTAYINAGAWSIGNELVYYTLTPFLIVAFSRRLLYGNLLVLASVVVGGLYAFSWLTPAEPLSWQWATYVDPMNNLCLYCLGIFIFYNVGRIGRHWALLIGAASIALLMFWPSTGDLIHTVTGWSRVVFCAASVGLTVAFYRCELPHCGALSLLGLASYGVYLLHPIVMNWIRPSPYLALLTIMLTVPAALAIYAAFEAPMVRVGKRLTAAALR